MTFYITFASIALAFNLFFGVYILYINPKNKIHITCSILLFFLVLISITQITINLIEKEEDLIFVFKYISSLTPLIPYLVVIISLQLSHLIRLRSIHYLLFFFPALVDSLFIFFATSLIDFTKIDGTWRVFEFTNTRVFYIHFICLCIYILGYCTTNIIWYIKTDSNKQKKQAMILLASFVLVVVLQTGYVIFFVKVFKIVKFSLVAIEGLFFNIWTIGFILCLTRYRILTINPTIISQDIISNVDECVVLFDPEGKIISINNKTKELLQTTSNYYNKHFSSIIKEHKYISEKFMNLFKNKISDFSYRLNLIGKGSHNIFVDAKFKMVRDKYMDVIGFLMIAKEVKELEELINKRTQQLNQVNEELNQQKEELLSTLENLKKTQQQLIESEKMASLGGLVAGVAHEINTPVGITITAVSGLLEETHQMVGLYKEDKISRTEFKEYLNNTNHAAKLIMSNMEKAATMVQSFKQISVDQSIETKRSFNLKEYTEDIIRSLYPKLKNRKINISLDIDSKLEVDSYPGAYSQVITNLVLNSLVHGFEEKGKGQINIKAISKNNSITIEYKDNGKGISQENLKKIFDPFFTTNKKTGTGLGLHIVYNLVTQKLGGKIECENVSKSGDEKGVKFIITITTNNKEAKS